MLREGCDTSQRSKGDPQDTTRESLPKERPPRGAVWDGGTKSIKLNRKIIVGTPSTRERHAEVTMSPALAKAKRGFRRDPAGQKFRRRREDAERTWKKSLPHHQPKTHYDLDPTRITRRMNARAGWPDPNLDATNGASTVAPR